ncbi:helix-turn-helix domain-containing protein [Streptomyces lunaelactis]|uniref:helix-turn-helix transcriptional regulator n=1 Tax=Streptomyces lunaelactis TaxID=1535768 RepID=UPI001584F615|nr:helix-turn-helix domain-containing protein [Streptomyces lunaelactis]NUK41213.1 helix-turn-helix domain-containing protein [Streptomyces lunaelactis]NUK50428.1 helix-turn-helix domain-containing protein [Streptomyces lunaelactis]NUK65457.1 helix-turn-helix domain-containing protein [Streptomyces lunaelactis]NUK91133.1 helix-turn-helix domain-containing protein [Streptomyces lunaelactis]
MADNRGVTQDNTALGTALRQWRDRTSPQDAGLPVNGVRRAPGLRREELAQLAGLSVDYVVRLERGRATSPSPQVLAALSRALRLSQAERDHLFLLGGQAVPSTGQVSQHVGPGVQRLLDQLRGTPFSVHDAAWNLISWNALWAALIGDPSASRGRERNVAWRHFTHLPTRVSHTPDEEARFETALVSDLRTSSARYPADTELRSLIADLRNESRRFDELWRSHSVGFHTADSKTIHHPELGPVTVDCDTLTVPGSDLRIAVFSAPSGTSTSEQFALLSTIGIQAIAAAAHDAGQ